MSAEGRMPAIDLTRHHFKRELGEFVIYGSWVYNDDQESHEPALVIIPAVRRHSFKPCVVALSAAFKYNDPKYCVQAAVLFVEAMGMTDSMSTSYTVATLIADHLLDLIKMPPNPVTAILSAEATIHLEGGKRELIQIHDWVSTQQH